MIPYLETHITEQCNLKCRGCSHFSVFAKPKHKDIDEFKREFERLSDIEEVQIIRLMGGEPLLNPKFMDYLYIARRCFPRSKIVLVTNGLLIERLMPHRAALVDLNIDVTMSNYHIDIQDTSALDRLPYTELHEKGQLYNISLDPTGSRDGGVSYNLCDLHINHWHYFQDGKFYPCCIAGTIHDFWDHFGLDWGIKDEDLGIDIFTHNAGEIEAFINSPCKLCRYCATDVRLGTYKPFERSKGDIKEWTI